MNKAIPRRRLLSVGVIVALAALVLVTTALILVDARPDSLKARAWAAEAAETGELPESLDNFISLPSAYRIHAKALMSPEQHSDLWRAWLDRFEATNDLNPEQIAFLRGTKALLTPALYDLNSPERRRLQREVAARCATERVLFTPAQVRALRTIGPVDDTQPADGFLVGFVRSLESALGIATVTASGTDDCACNPSLGEECGNCENKAELCKNKFCWEVFFNCGCKGEDTCTKKCELPSL